MTPRHASRGEMISTLCFAGAGLWCLSAGLDTAQPKATFLFVCAGACLAGAARHPLARLLRRD